MKEVLIIRRFSVCLIAATIGLGSNFALAPVFAQTRPAAPPVNAATPQVSLTPTDTKTMASALRSLARQANVAFVVEGIPFRARESAPPLSTVVAKYPASGVPLETAIAQIASAYDYEVERKGGVFLLRKRYTNPNDLPEVTTEELRLALRDASRAASAFPAPVDPPYNYDAPSSPFAEAFFKMLPSDVQEAFRKRAAVNNASVQRSGLETHNGTLQIASLSAPQKEALLSCAITRYIQAATQAATDAFQALQTMERGGTLFSIGPPSADYDGQKPLAVKSKPGAKAGFPVFAPYGQLWDAPPTPADYAKSGAALPLFEQSEADQTQTLQSLCDGGGGANKNAPSYNIDPELQTKRILVVAPDKSGADADKLRAAIFRAAGHVYGLRVLGKEGGALQMTHARTAPPTKLSGLSDVVLAAIPSPLLRAFYGAMPAAEAKALAAQMKYHENEPNFDPKKPSELDLYAARMGGRGGAAEAIRTTALHRFRVLLTPRLVDGKTVSAEDLTIEEKRLLFLALATTALDDMEKLNKHQSPPTRAGLEQGQLNWGWNAWDDTKPHFMFTLNLRNDADEKEFGSYQIGNVEFPAPKAPAPK